MTMAEKSSRGGKKIKMEKMSKESHLIVTFSKRRNGLFKKASELSTLCGAELAIIVFSPGKKAFCFGHPCVNTLINRYLPDMTSDAATSGTSDAHAQLVEEARVKELNKELMEMNEEIKVEKKRVEELKMRKASEIENGHWWNNPVDELSLKELELLKKAMEKLKKTVKERSDEMEVAETLLELKNHARIFYQGSSSSLVMSKGTFGNSFAGNFVEGSSSSSAFF